jgi:amidase
MYRAERPLHSQTGSAVRQAIQSGELSVIDVVDANLTRLEEREPDIQAWTIVDAERARTRAATIKPDLPLSGFTFGVKDVIDTRFLPTGYGSPIYKDFLPEADAACVQRMEDAGAIMLGKTVTCEFATYFPGKTRNPYGFDHTPGGSSSGSAAAVADGHASVAFGTQTAGSIIRPAGFCGVLGFKPSYGRYAIQGMKPLALSLDTLGLFARGFEDLLAVDGVLADDVQDIGEHLCEDVAVLRLPWDDRMEPAMRRSFDGAVKRLLTSGFTIREISAPAWFGDVEGAQADIMAHEASYYLATEASDHWDQISPKLQALIGNGRHLSPDAVQSARRVVRKVRRWAEQMLADVGAFLLPSAFGAAPKGLEGTGDPVYCRPWTAAGLPTVGFPIGFDEGGLPLGAQLVGPGGGDRALIRFAAHLAEAVRDGERTFKPCEGDW